MRGDKPIPTLRSGQRLRAGDISSVSGGVPREIVGGSGVRVQVIGGRAVLKSTAKRGGGGGLSIDTVLTLPAIPSSGGRIVFWTSAGAGTGDDQCWMAHAGQTAWTPMQFLTSLSGVP